ncbi:hypothetical protein [Spirillospora sp. NPDC047279]|uniref:hypothetical protein n=1 Tax=Spirillospora sp. NPDC047279 TaxID=3155478 RepID=UPI0033D60D42
MIEIRTYLETSDERLVEIGSATEAPPDENYVEGALELTVNGVRIIDVAMGDYIDQLWSYISDMVSDLLATGSADTRFPETPTTLSFQRQGHNRVLVTLEKRGERRVASAAEDELVDALRTHGAEFFAVMTRLLPQAQKSHEAALSRLLG